MEGEANEDIVGDPTTFQQGSIMDIFRSKMNKNSQPAINNVAKPKDEVVPLVGDHFDPKSVPFNPTTKPPIKFVSEEEQNTEMKKRVALWNEIKAYISDIKKSYPTIDMPVFTYKSKSVAVSVKLETLQDHFDTFQREVNKRIPDAKAQMKALEVIAQKKAEEQTKVAINDVVEENQINAIEDANNQMSNYEEENMDPMDGVLDTPQNAANKIVAQVKPGLVHFGENCYNIEYAAARYKLAVQRAHGLDMPTVVPMLEKNKENIIDAWQGVGEKYKDSIIVRILDDPLARLAAAHTEPVLAFFDDLAAAKKNQPAVD